MNATDIQRLLNEQRKSSPLTQKSEKQLNYVVAANNRTSDHYIGSMTDPNIRPLVEEKRKQAVKQASEEGKFSDGQKRRYQNPNERLKTANSIKKSWQDPESNKRRNQAAQTKWSDELKAQASESHIKQWDDEEKRRKHSLTMSAIRTRPINTPEGAFVSVKEAALHYGISTATISYRIRKYPTKYYYITKEEYDRLTDASK